MFWLFNKPSIKEDDIIRAYKEFFWNIKTIEDARYFSQWKYWYDVKITLDNWEEYFVITKEIQDDKYRKNRLVFIVEENERCLQTNTLWEWKWFVFFFLAPDKYYVYDAAHVWWHVTAFALNSKFYWEFDFDTLRYDLKYLYTNLSA